ncbi:toll/interleukin-1 receptor domain-containing protein [Pseudomonas akapageensis]|uniref:toll/interleukin-1 receptor domain-containing protein n=1 Tax=Pseudomonas akapageensis TaxID=2609961 RepID=UPI00140CBEDA|nr:toll/interleukin-1 receptor domain-containing protein [Pseudomonas akapageensis]
MSLSATDEAKPIHDAFVSYSRRDTAFAQQLIDQLERQGRSIVYDRDDIHDGEAWRRKLTSLIQASQNIIVLISRASLDSRECRWELDLAGTLNKRLVTVRIDAVTPAELPESLGAIQWIDATATADTEAIAARIIAALDIDQQWAERHTRLTFQALAWRENGTLLRGADLRNAETMVATYQGKQPLTTAEHMALLLASRKAGARRLRLTVLGTAAVGLVLAVLSVNWLAERRNAEYTGLRRQAESALNQADGDLAAAVASLGHVVRTDNLGLLPEYRDVVPFWQVQLRALDDIVPGMKIGDPLLWRATLYVKTDTHRLRPLSGGTSMRIAASEDNQSLVTADYTSVSLLALPALEPLLQVQLPARERPDAIAAIPNTGWLLASGKQTVVNNDEDDPVSVYDCFTLVMPSANVADAKPAAVPEPDPADGSEAQVIHRLSGIRGSAALHFCPEVNLLQVSAAADVSRRYLLIAESSGEFVQGLTIDLQSGAYVSELPKGTQWDARTRVTLPEANQVHDFPQMLAQEQLWREATATELEQSKQPQDARQRQHEQAQQLLESADASQLKDDEKSVLANLGETVEGPWVVTDVDAVFPWGLYVTGNSYGAFGACKIATASQRIEWCRQQEILVIESGHSISPDQRWVANANRDGWSTPLELIDLTTMAHSELKELPGLVVAQAFDAASNRLALLSETNELWLYALEHGAAPRLMKHRALGEAVHERCTDPQNPRLAQPGAGSLAFAGEHRVVGLGTDGVLFGFDSQNGDLTWRRPLQSAIDRCTQRLAITASGGFFALHGADVVQLFHAVSGVPLSGPVTLQALTGSPPGEGFFENLQLTGAGDVSVTAGERVFVRPRPNMPANTDLEHYTGISVTDGRTSLKLLPGAFEQ